MTTGRAAAFADAGRQEGLSLHAPDVGFRSGDGATVRGDELDLLAALCGRAALLDRLDGPGVAMPRPRPPSAGAG